MTASADVCVFGIELTRRRVLVRPQVTLQCDAQPLSSFQSLASTSYVLPLSGRSEAEYEL